MGDVEKLVGTLLLIIIVASYFSQTTVPVDTLQLVISNNKIQSGTLSSSNVTLKERYFSAYPSGTYTVIGFASNQTQRIDNIGDGSVILYFDFGNYNCINVTLKQQRTVTVDSKQVCKNGFK